MEEFSLVFWLSDFCYRFSYFCLNFLNFAVLLLDVFSPSVVTLRPGDVTRALTTTVVKVHAKTHNKTEFPSRFTGFKFISRMFGEKSRHSQKYYARFP